MRFGDFDPNDNMINVMTMNVSNDLSLSVVAQTEVGDMPGPVEDEKDTARVFCAATQRLAMGLIGEGQFGRTLR